MSEITQRPTPDDEFNEMSREIEVVVGDPPKTYRTLITVTLDKANGLIVGFKLELLPSRD